LLDSMKWKLAQFMDPHHLKKSTFNRLKTLILHHKQEFLDLKEPVGSGTAHENMITFDV
jgi:hypothetical protein